MLEDLPGVFPSPDQTALEQDSTDEHRGAVAGVRQFGGKAGTKMKPHLERTLQHIQLPHSQECEAWGKERWEKGTSIFFIFFLILL